MHGISAPVSYSPATTKRRVKIKVGYAVPGFDVSGCGIIVKPGLFGPGVLITEQGLAAMVAQQTKDGTLTREVDAEVDVMPGHLGEFTENPAPMVASGNRYGAPFQR